MTNRKRRGAKNPTDSHAVQSRRKPPARSSVDPQGRSLRLYGVHPVAAALANPARHCRRLTATSAALAGLRQRLGVALERDGLVIDEASRDEVARLFDDVRGGGAVHQGLALEVAPLAPPVFDDICATHKAPRLVLLDRVNDPQNLGAVIRAEVHQQI